MRKRKFHFNWRLAVAHILVNAIALGLTIAILPGLRITHVNVVWGLLVSGAIFGVLNAIVKPILQFFTFNFLFVTYGLVLILINMVLLWMLNWLTPDWFEASGFINLTLAAIFIGLFSILLESLLGMTAPIIDYADQKASPEQPYDTLGEIAQSALAEATGATDRVSQTEDDPQ